MDICNELMTEMFKSSTLLFIGFGPQYRYELQQYKSHNVFTAVDWLDVLQLAFSLGLGNIAFQSHQLNTSTVKYAIKLC